MDVKLLVFRSLHILSMIFFLLSAFVQKNDPDPELWVPIYMIPAISSFAIFLKPTMCEEKLMKTLDSGCLFFGSLMSAHVIRHSYDFKENFVHWVVHAEAGREFGGLLVILLWILFMHDLSNLSTKIWVCSLIILVPFGLWGYIYGNQEFRRLWPQHCQTALYPD